MAARFWQIASAEHLTRHLLNSTADRASVGVINTECQPPAGKPNPLPVYTRADDGLHRPALGLAKLLRKAHDGPNANAIKRQPTGWRSCNQLREWGETVQNHQVITDVRNIAGVTRQITGNIKDLTQQGLELQQQVQADLRKMQNIRGLYVSNPTQLFAEALSMAGRAQTNAYLPTFSKAQRLRQALQLNNAQQDVQRVYDIFSRTAGGSISDRMTSRDYQAKKEEAAVSTYAYEEMARKHKIDIAMGFYKIADKMMRQSVGMNATLKNPGRYAMTDGERLVALDTSNDNMIKAMKLRLEADKLLGEASQNGPMQGAAEGAYADLILAKRAD